MLGGQPKPMMAEIKIFIWTQWHTSLIPALGRQRQADLSEFEANLVSREYSRTAMDTQINSVSKTKNYQLVFGNYQLMNHTLPIYTNKTT